MKTISNALIGGTILFLSSGGVMGQSCPLLETFDYIIVGTNTGSVVARYLHDNTNKRILLVDQGFEPSSSPDYMLYTPRGVPEYTYGAPEFNRFPNSQGVLQNGNSYPEVTKMETVPQIGAFFRKVNAYFGNVQGGTSLLNSMYWIDSSAQTDLNSWPNGLKFNDMINSYKYVEKYSGDMTGVDTNIRGLNGFLKVSDESCCYNDQTSGDFFQTCANKGLYVNNDMNSNNLGGCGYVDRNIHLGRRQTPYEAFVKPILGSTTRLVSRARIEVTKVNVNLFTRQATSITYNNLATGATNCRAWARNEIILSAGAVGTPKILLNSAIGPALDLLFNGILSIADLPVGKNLADDVGVPLVYASAIPGNPILNRTALVNAYPDYYNKITTGKQANDNIWTYAVSNSIIFIKDDPAKDNDPSVPRNIQSYVSRSGPLNQIPDPSGDVVIFPVLLVDAKSRGAVTLNGTINNVQIDPNYFTHPDDIDAAYRGFLRMRDLAESDPFGKRLGPEIAPGIFTNADQAKRKRHIDLRFAEIDEMFENESKKRSSPLSEDEKFEMKSRLTRSVIEEDIAQIVSQLLVNVAKVQKSQDLPTVEEVLIQRREEIDQVVQVAIRKRDALYEALKEFSLKLYFRFSSLVGQHFCCTAKMGVSGDPNRVVDTRGRVLTLSKLRIIDMSSLPEIPRSNPMKRLLAFGRRLAEFVVQDNA